MAITDAPNQGFKQDPAYKTHQVECYIGSKILTENGLYGTICFISINKRNSDFTKEERILVDTVARIVGNLIQNNHESDSTIPLDTDTKYKSLMDTGSNGVLIFEEKTGKIIETNERLYKMTGYDTDDIIGSEVTDIFVSKLFDSGDTMEINEAKNIAGMKYNESQIYLKTSDEANIPVDVSRSEIQMDGISYYQMQISDISDRMERMNEIKLKTRAIDEAPIGISITDIDNGQPLKYINSEFEQLTGYQKENVIGTNCKFLQGEDTSQESVEKIRTALENKQSVETDILNYSENGRAFWNRLTIKPIEIGGEKTHFVGFQKDVTERKRKQRIIRVQNRVLRHNIRNRLSVIIGYADMVADECEDANIEKHAQKISDTADELVNISNKSQIIEDIADSESVSESGTCDVGDIINTVVGELENEYELSNSDISVDQSEDLKANINGMHLQTVLKELGENAVIHGRPPVEYKVKSSSKRSIIEVVDHVSGLDENEQTVLETGVEKPLEHGSGIGLWIVAWIITDCGGELELEESDGKTIIRVSIPKAEERGSKNGGVLWGELT